jgi:hypothetical protein
LLLRARELEGVVIGWRRALAAVLVVLVGTVAAALPAQAFWDRLLGPPGSGIHIFPDWRPPAQPPCPPPGQGGSGPPPLPPTFGTLIASYVKFCDDVAAMKNWFMTLTPAEQEQYRPQYDATLARLVAAEEQIAGTIVVPLEQGNERPMYGLFDIIRKLDPIRARTLFIGVLERIAVRVNMDYISDPQNPIKARRARDVVAIRTWIGRA